MNGKSLEPKEWDFTRVPAGEQFVCMLYELARESPSMRRKAAEAWEDCSEWLKANGKSDWPLFRPLAHDFLEKNAQAEYFAYANLGCTKFQELPWTELSVEQRDRLLPMMFSWYVKDRLTMPGDLPVRAHAYKKLTIDGVEVSNADLPMPPNGECGFCLTVDLVSEDDDLIESFMQHVRAMRQMQGLPAEVNRPSKTGRKLVLRDPKAMLVKIGLMRLDAARGPVAAFKALQSINADRPESNPTEAVNNAMALVVKAMRYYLAVPDNEFPCNYRHPQPRKIRDRKNSP